MFVFNPTDQPEEGLSIIFVFNPTDQHEQSLFIPQINLKKASPIVFVFNPTEQPEEVSTSCLFLNPQNSLKNASPTMFEAKGPGGSVMLIEAVSVKIHHTRAELQSLVKKCG